MGGKRRERKNEKLDDRDGIIVEPTSLRTQLAERVILEYE